VSLTPDELSDWLPELEKALRHAAPEGYAVAQQRGLLQPWKMSCCGPRNNINNGLQRSDKTTSAESSFLSKLGNERRA
jgi:hypothetical protein